MSLARARGEEGSASLPLELRRTCVHVVKSNAMVVAQGPERQRSSLTRASPRRPPSRTQTLLGPLVAKALPPLVRNLSHEFEVLQIAQEHVYDGFEAGLLLVDGLH